MKISNNNIMHNYFLQLILRFDMINNIYLFSQLFIMTLLLPTHATETLEQTLGNATIAADKSVEAARSASYIASNTSGFLTTLNTGIKALSVGYGVALTGASAVDAITAKNTYSRCMFGVGCAFGIAGTASSALTAFNVSVALSPLAMVSSATGTACFWIGRKVNALARVGDIPAI